jgi:HEAT repeat protein
MRTAFPPDRWYAFLKERPRATVDQKPELPLVLAKRAGWFTVGLVVSLGIALTVAPWTAGGALLAGSIVLGAGAFVTAFHLLAGGTGRDWPDVVVLVPVLAGGVGLLGHAVAAVVPWGWSPYAAGLIGAGVVVGLTTGAAALRQTQRPGPQRALGASVAGTLPIALGLSVLPGWPLGFAWTWAGALVLALAGTSLWWARRDGKGLFMAGLIGLLVPGLALATLGAVWLTGPPAWYYLLPVLAAVVFLFVSEPDGQTAALGLWLTAGIGGLVGGTTGGTLGAWGFLVLILFGSAAGELSVTAKRWVNAGNFWLEERFSPLVVGLLSDPLLRALLIAAGRRPLRWRHFLAYAESTLLLKSASADREFVHRLLRDDFALLDLLPELSVPERRLATIRKLAFQGEAAIETLREYLVDQGPDLQEAAAVGLGQIASPRVLGLLETALQGPNPAVRRAAVAALWYRSSAESKELGELLAREQDVSVILSWLRKAWSRGSEDWELSLVLRFLSNTQFEPTVVAEVFAHAGGYVTDPPKYSWVFGWDRVDALMSQNRGLWGTLGEALAAHNVLLSSLADPRPAVRAGAVIVGGVAGLVPLKALLERLKTDPDAGVRRAAVWSLLQAGDRLAHAPQGAGVTAGMMAIRDGLVAALVDVEPAFPRAAAAALLRLGFTGSDAPLEPIFHRYIDQGACRAVAETLGPLGDPPARASLEEALKNRDALLRRAAAWALGRLGDPASRAALERTLRRDADPGARAEAALALARVAGPAALPALRRALSDPHEAVRAAARASAWSPPATDPPSATR